MTLPDMLHFARTGGIPVSPDLLLRRIDEIIEAGFDVLELSLDILNWYPGAIDKTVLRRLADVCARDGKILTAHLPFVNLPTLTHVEDMRRASAANVLNAMRHVESLPVTQFVLHLDGAFLQGVIENYDLPSEVHHDLKGSIFSQGERTLDELLKHVSREKMLLENLPAVPTSLMVGWAKNWDLDICLDVGHAMLKKKDILTFVDQLLKDNHRLREYHVHDVVEIAENGNERIADHRKLGIGLVDLAGLSDRVYQNGERPVVILEMRFEWARESLPVWQRASRKTRP